MTPLAGANVWRVSVTVPYTTTSASPPASATVIWRHDASAGEAATLMPTSSSGSTRTRPRTLTQVITARGRAGSLGGLTDEKSPQPLAQCLQDGHGDQGVLPDHVVELPAREHQTAHWRECGHGRGARTTIQQRDLSEEVAWPELPEMATLSTDLGSAGQDDEELPAA